MNRAGYELLVSSEWTAMSDTELVDRVERALLANPHYEIARRLGQLAPLSVVRVDEDAPRNHLRSHALGLGDAKPEFLLRITD
jgi:hypothetical protein